jgi:hypothetical protein
MVVALLTATYGQVPAMAQEPPDLAGRWTLNRALSPSPKEIGFDADWMKAAGNDAGPAASGGGGGRGRRGSGGSGVASGGAFSTHPESAEDAARVRQLTAEVRNPTAHVTIAETPAAVTITDDQGRARTFHPDGRQEALQLGDLPLVVTAKWEAGHLVVLYAVEEGRQLRYSYSLSENPRQLIVDVKFVERSGGDEVRRIYEPADPNERPTSSAPAAAGARAPDASSGASATGEHAVFNQQPGAELRGLTSLGVVVEDLSEHASACGLNQSTIEATVSKSLSDAGLKVRRNSDEDTYVYVDIVTGSLSGGLCVSRYDAWLYTHTTAKLSYQETPVLVEVSLLHRGGLAGGVPASHGASVVQGVKQYVDEFVSQIRDANK